MRLLPAEGSKIPSLRMAVTYAVMAGIGIAFVAQLFSLQIVQGTSYLEAARENRITNIRLPAARGVIYDRNGSLLVRNLPSYNVLVTPEYLPDSEAEVEAIYARLSALTGVPVVTSVKTPGARCLDERGIRQLVEERASIAPYEAWPVACNVGETVARIIREQQVDMPGVSIEAQPVRDYTTGALASAILGYMGPIPDSLKDTYEALGFVVDRDRIGYAGIEAAYQTLLAGSNGFKQVEEDVAGNPLREVGEVKQPTPGYSLRLTIDTRLQAAADTALRNQMEFVNRYAGEVRTPLGAVIAMNPQTGEILALTTLPTYDSTRFTPNIPLDYYEELIGDTRGKPLVDHAISSTFPPGSTFKLVTSVGALNEGVIDPNARIFDPGKITIHNAYYPNDPGQDKDFFCHDRAGHGWVDFLHALAFSCNVYFYEVGGGFPNGPMRPGGLGIDDLYRYAHALGYGFPLGLDLPAEEGGLIPSKDWKRITLGESWSTGDTYNTATGQGYVLATPLQVLTAAATIGNNGKVMWPHLVDEVLDGEGNVVKQIEPCVMWDLLDGVVTPVDEIGSCRDLPTSITDQLESRPFTPDLDVKPAVIELVREGMRMVVAYNENGRTGTAYNYARIGARQPSDPELISSAGKTGTGEFCDEVASEKGLCVPGAWPSHAWYVAFAPYENPEIAVIAFVYNGTEGAVTSGPIVRQVLEAYFNLKAIDAARQP
jgi:penicillin-binding protein 2